MTDLMRAKAYLGFSPAYTAKNAALGINLLLIMGVMPQQPSGRAAGKVNMSEIWNEDGTVMKTEEPENKVNTAEKVAETTDAGNVAEAGAMQDAAVESAAAETEDAAAAECCAEETNEAGAQTADATAEGASVQNGEAGCSAAETAGMQTADAEESGQESTDSPTGDTEKQPAPEEKPSMKEKLNDYGVKLRSQTARVGSTVREQTARVGNAVREAAEKSRQNAAERASQNVQAQEQRPTDDAVGTVRIADDVVAMIASVAAQEVDGVAGMAAGTTREFLGSIGVKDPQKGGRVEVNDRNVRVDLQIIMGYGFNIPATSSKVQARVKQAIENMTGLSVTDVNVRIAGIKLADNSDSNE